MTASAATPDEAPRDPLLVALGTRVRGLRARRGITRKRLAQLAEVDFTNQTNPRPAKAADYERLLTQAM